MSDPVGRLQARAAPKVAGTPRYNKMTSESKGARRHMKHKVNRQSRMSKR